MNVLPKTGAGAFAAAVNYSVGLDPRAVTLGDFDGNLSLDIAVAAHDSREINVLSNLGNGSFVSAVDLSVGAQLRPDGVVAADLNCDGDLDLAAGTSGNALNFASVFLRVGASNFSGPTNYAVSGVNPSDIVAADFDADGDPDLATVNPDSNNVSVLAGDGTGAFGSEILLTAGTTPDNLAAGDLDGNGAKELVAVNRDSGNVSIFNNQNSAWTDLGLGLAGTHGVPTLTGTGVLEAGAPARLQLSGALENRPALFVAGLSRIDVPFKGGTFVPALDVTFVVSTGPTGDLTFNITWPADIQKGISLYAQYWIDDPGAAHGFSSTNAIESITQ